MKLYGLKMPTDVKLSKEQLEEIWKKHGIRLNEEIYLKKEDSKDV